MNDTIEGAPNPIAAPIIARIKCERAFGEPITNEKAANTSPRIEASGRIVPINRLCTAERVDSTLANPAIGQRTTITTKIVKKTFLFFSI